jgi:probable selenate reductase FAD-binding subunit
MTKVERYSKPSTLEEALEAKRADPDAAYLAGGTFLLAGDLRDKCASVIDLSAALPRELRVEGETLSIGSLMSFQELAEAEGLPAFLAEAVLTMANRNTRNRATAGGNLGADKSCSSLIPILLALDAELQIASPSRKGIERMKLEAWLASRDASDASRKDDLVLSVELRLESETRAAYRRWNRVSCDLSVLGAAAAYRIEAGAVAGLRLALGGLGPKARRRPDIEALFEGQPLPSREKIEEAVSPHLHPIDDARASAAFKRLRGAQLVADALCDAYPARDAPPRQKAANREARP